MRKLLDMTGSSKSKIKEKKKKTILSVHLTAENIRTLMLKKGKHVEQLFKSERNMEETRE